MKTIILVVFVLLATRADAVLIDFEIGPRCIGANTNCAPELFSGNPLTTRYQNLGVIFSGAAPGQGGEILWDGSFGHAAHSGVAILAFNTSSLAGQPIFPEILTFLQPVSHVEIWGASGQQCFTPECVAANTQTFVMEAFNSLNALVGSSTVATFNFSRLSVDGSGITSVRINRLSGSAGSEFDDLLFTPQAVPEPSALLLLLIGLAAPFARSRKIA